MKRSSLVCALGALTAFGAVAWTPQPADACGGTFCDGGPLPMPVDQSGENILFVRDGDYIEAHIQIQYVGEAQDFAWVIPLQSLPEFSVGSEPLFQNLLGGTVPTYFTQTMPDDCGDGGGLTAGPPNGDNASSSAGGDETGAAGDGGEGGPQIVLQETVGAYEITVLQGGTAAEVVTWLDDNGYQQDPEAEPILQSYLDENFLFGAVKLTGGADVDEIHPVVLRFLGTEPCIPLRLTRIAAVDDMDVRSFFLGAARTVPQNYRHVLINQVKIDWTPGNLAANYKDIITQAVDAPEASGRAFVTEYAGTSDAVPRGGLFSPAWNSQVFEAIEPIGVIDELTSQGLFFCDFDFGNGCSPTHPLVQPILDQFLPVPAGVDPNAFYECVSCYEAELDLGAWNGPGFAQALQDRVIVPGEHAQTLLDANDYLTRMYTTISPGEMTQDPMFHENPELAEVTATQNGTQRILCNGDSVYILPDGRQVYVPLGSPWPDFDSEPAWSMPSDEEVQEVMAAGAPVVLANHTQAIDDALAAYNSAQGWAGGGADEGGSAADGDDAGGCGCRTTGGGMAGVMIMLLGLGLGVVSRRRRLA
jgi:MYXO-CTERM domain-containing protein